MSYYLKNNRFAPFRPIAQELPNRLKDKRKHLRQVSALPPLTHNEQHFIAQGLGQGDSP